MFAFFGKMLLLRFKKVDLLEVARGGVGARGIPVGVGGGGRPAFAGNATTRQATRQATPPRGRQRSRQRHHTTGNATGDATDNAAKIKKGAASGRATKWGGAAFGHHENMIDLDERIFVPPNESSVAALGASLVTKQAGRVPQHD